MKVSIVTLSLLGAGAALAAPPDEAVCNASCQALVQMAARQQALEPAGNGHLTVEDEDRAVVAELARTQAGSVRVDQLESADFAAFREVGDPFRGGLNGPGQARDMRVDDGIAYQGRVANLKVGSRWSRGDVDGSPSGRAWGMTAGVKIGALTIRAAHQNRNVVRITRPYQPVLSMAARNSIVSANMRFGWGTAYAAYSDNRGWGNSPLFNPDNPYGAAMAAAPSTRSRDVLAGVAVPVNRRTTVLASVVHRDDRDLANHDARQMAVGATYAVSRKLDFYAAYTHIQHLSGSTGPANRRASAVNVGMRRAF